MFRRISSRRRGTSLVLVAATTLLLLTSLGAAQAQSNYPLEDTIIITDQNGNVVSDSTEVAPGQQLTVTATGWLANSDVTLSYFCGSDDPIVIGTYKADAAGVLREDFFVPDVGSGRCTLRLTGVGSNGNARTIEASMLVKARMLAVAGAAVAGATTTRGAPLARTGLDVWAFAQVGFALLAIGAALFLAVRRPRVGQAK